MRMVCLRSLMIGLLSSLSVALIEVKNLNHEKIQGLPEPIQLSLEEWAKYTSHSSVDCGGVIDGDRMEEDSGVITSPNYPDPYPQGAICVWTIKAGMGRRIKIEFEEFDVTETVGCRDDYLTAKSGTIPDAALEVQVDSAPSDVETYHGPFCGTRLPGIIYSTHDVIEVEFRSSPGGETCKGFLARYSFVEVVASCGEEVSALEFEFVNLEYPQKVANKTAECQLKISHECGTEICQIKLDFIEFTLQPPSLGECTEDEFIVRSNNPKHPILCGVNSGQHVYVDVEGREETEIYVFLKEILPLPVGHNDEDDPDFNHTLEYHHEIEDNRRWRVKIHQIPCDCKYDDRTKLPPRAPSGCLQYYDTLRGRIKSFNFHGQKQDLQSCWLPDEAECNVTVWTGQLNNLDYNVCIKRMEGHCGVKYFTKEENNFLVSGSMTDGQTGKNLHGSSCASNFVGIPNGRTRSSSKTYDRFCGSDFGIEIGEPVYSFSQPFHFLVKTNKDEFSRGYGVEFGLIPCSTSSMFS